MNTRWRSKRRRSRSEAQMDEKYIKAVFATVSATRPRADVGYCIHALAGRLGKDAQLGSSDYSVWVRNYALFLEERLECFRILKYDVETQRRKTKDLDTPELLDQLPALLQLLFRIVSCQPQGAAVHYFVIRYALSMVASESIRVYNAIKDGTINLADKFFEMRKYDAQKALDIYRRAGKQAERLSEFHDMCTSLDIGRGERYAKIEQPPVSFIHSMEEYIQNAPHTSTVRKDMHALDAPEVILAIECEKTPEKLEKSPSSPEPLKVEAPVQPDDLLVMFMILLVQTM